MARQKTLRTELEELRQELAELRDTRSVDSSTIENRAATPVETKPDTPDQMENSGGDEDDIESAIRQFAKAGEKEFEKNPLLAVGLALLVGILIGKSSR